MPRLEDVAQGAHRFVGIAAVVKAAVVVLVWLLGSVLQLRRGEAGRAALIGAILEAATK